MWDPEILLILIFFILVFVWASVLSVRCELKTGGSQKKLRTKPDCDFSKIFNNAQSGFKHETMVRAIFNCYVSKGEFHEVDGRTERWLYHDGVPLSLDGYNPKLKLAFEYQGRGHYEDVFDDHDRYVAQRRNDDIKQQLCHKHGVELIIIHYLVETADLEDYVWSRLSDLGYARGKAKKYMEVIPEPFRQEFA